MRDQNTSANKIQPPVCTPEMDQREKEKYHGREPELEEEEERENFTQPSPIINTYHKQQEPYEFL